MKNSTLVSSALCMVAILSSLGGAHGMPVSGEARGGVLFVKVGESGDCSSWGNACDLQSALSSAVAGDEIWVAEGTYYPTDGTDRTVSFELKNGVAVYGGFIGTETALDQRNWVEHPTILSGNVGDVDDASDNSYHVVYGTGLDNTATLDGFTITLGFADDVDHNDGGGMYLYQSSPTLTNVTFTANSAQYGGGGMYNYNYSSPMLTNVIFSGNSAGHGAGGMHNRDYSSPTLTNVTFSYNASNYHGGGIYNNSSSPTLTNVTFHGNEAAVMGGGMFNTGSSPTLTNVTFSGNFGGLHGGGMYNEGSNPILVNVTFSANSATYGGGIYNRGDSPTMSNVTIVGNSPGGGMYNSQSVPILTNAILWGNSPYQILNEATWLVITYSIIQDGYEGEGNINSDPFLGPLAYNGGGTKTHSLRWDSPAIDSGSPIVCPATDQRGYHRPIDGNDDGVARCDMGAYEYGSYFPYYSYLPLIVKPTVPILDPLVNGNFEDGKLGWSESATVSRDLIVNSGFPGGVTPHSGTWAAWLGGDHYEDTSTISQYVSIPVGRSMLHFWYWISALENCGPDDFTLSVQSTPLLTWDLCGATDTGGWVEHSIDLSAYAGTSAWIAFEVTLDDADTSQVFIDDVSFEIH